MDSPGKYPIIAVLAALRWLTEILAWKRGWDFVSRVAATILHQKSDCPTKVESYSVHICYSLIVESFQLIT